MTREDIIYIMQHIDGDIEGFPPALVVDIIQRSVRTGHSSSVESALRYIRESRTWCFDWSRSPEGDRFWRTIIKDKQFHLYFETFPNANKLLLGIEESMLNLKNWE